MSSKLVLDRSGRPPAVIPDGPQDRAGIQGRCAQVLETVSLGPGSPLRYGRGDDEGCGIAARTFGRAIGAPFDKLKVTKCLEYQVIRHAELVKARIVAPQAAGASASLAAPDRACRHI